MKRALLYFIVFVAVQLLATWAVYSVWLMCSGFSLSDTMGMFMGVKPVAGNAGMIILASLVCSLLVAAVFLWCHWVEMSPVWLRTRQWDVLLWSAAASVGTLLPSMGLQELLPDVPDTTAETFRLIMGNNMGYVVLCLVAPVVEELVFRGAILRALLGSMKSRWTAIFVSAMLFALVHVNPAQMPHALLIGILFGWMYSRTGSILPGIVLHCVNNTVACAFVLIYSGTQDITLSQLFGGDAKRVALAMLFSLFILLPALFQLNQRMRKA